MLAYIYIYIPAPWIRHGLWFFLILIFLGWSTTDICRASCWSSFISCPAARKMIYKCWAFHDCSDCSLPQAEVRNCKTWIGSFGLLSHWIYVIYWSVAVFLTHRPLRDTFLCCSKRQLGLNMSEWPLYRWLHESYGLPGKVKLQFAMENHHWNKRCIIVVLYIIYTYSVSYIITRYL